MTATTNEHSEDDRDRQRPVPTERYKTLLFRLMQTALVIALIIGLYQRNPSVIVNSVVALGVTVLPAILEHNYKIRLGSGITLWITLAVLLHTLGALGPYEQVWWWDHMTHALSASVVAGAGYATVRAIDRYDDRIYLPSAFMVLFIFLFVMAFGVTWEILEFLIDQVSEALGMETVLTQYGLDDTVVDLIFDAVGAVMFAALGTDHASRVSDTLHHLIETHEP